MKAFRRNDESGRRAPYLTLGLLGVALVVAFLLYLSIGSANVPVGRILEILLNGDRESIDGTTIWVIRFPRACYALLIGASLAVVGSAFQALFRNPLADPYIVGVSSGAAVGGALAIVTGIGASWSGFWHGFGVTAAATAGGLASLLLVMLLARRRNILNTQTLLLAGVVMGSLLSALLSLILLWSGQDTNVVFRWLLGSLSGAQWNRAGLMAIVLFVSLVVLVGQSKRLNLFSFGEETAQRLGVNTRRLKPLILVTGSVLVAVTVGSAGVIGFLGLVAPHIARRVLGTDWRWSLVGSALIGGVLCLGADLVAQRAVASTEVPVGIVTAVLGAPFLLVLLNRRG